MQTYLKTALAILLIAGMGFLLLIKIPWTVDGGTLEVFFGVFGVVYAIVVGFALFVVMDNYSSIRNHINSEINALQDLRDFLVYVDDNDEVVAELKSKIKTYVESVVHKEWSEMRSAHEIDLDTSPELYDIMISINRIEPTNQSDFVSLEMLMETMAQITTHRTNRLGASCDKLPPLLNPLLILLSMIVVFVFTLLPIKDELVRFVLNGANIFALCFIYVVIADLNNPFKGFFSIDNQSYQDLLKKL